MGKHYEVLREVVGDYELEYRLEGAEVIEEYWVVEPFVKALIVIEGYKNVYFSAEPPLSDEEAKLASSIIADLRRILTLRDVSFSIEERAELLVKSVNRILKEYGILPEGTFYPRLLYYLFRDFFGLGPIDPLMEDKYIEDISCDGYGTPIFIYHSKYGNLRTNISFEREELDRLVMRLAQVCGKHISIANPIIDATLPDGSRLQATYSTEVTPKGSSFTIRKFTVDPLTPVDLIMRKTIPSGVMAYLWLCVEHKLSAMIVGETASGKTTTLNAILMFVPPDAKIVSIEDTREIKLLHENWLAEVTRTGIGEVEIDMYDLLRAALRQRPEYIVVGEIRGAEAQVLFQAMSTGHACYSTLHAGDINQVVYRLENEPLNVPRSMIQFLDVILFQTMWMKGKERFRRAKEVNEILGIDPVDKNLLVNQFVRWDPKLDDHIEVSPPRKLEKIADHLGTSVDEVVDELRRRKEFLELMVKRGIRDYRTFTSLVNAYYYDPEIAFSKLGV
ncbi:MAG: type II/IV secretion system ATPase subunit [Archaeoglobaceae archaeon]